MKIIFHIDLDSYFVNPMCTIKPELNNLPVSVSLGKNESIVTALSYEVKKMGAKKRPYLYLWCTMPKYN